MTQGYLQCTRSAQSPIVPTLCVDDNARALLVACALNAPGEQRLPETLTSRLAAFVQHA